MAEELKLWWSVTGKFPCNWCNLELCSCSKSKLGPNQCQGSGDWSFTVINAEGYILILMSSLHTQSCHKGPHWMTEEKYLFHKDGWIITVLLCRECWSLLWNGEGIGCWICITGDQPAQSLPLSHRETLHQALSQILQIKQVPCTSSLLPKPHHSKWSCSSSALFQASSAHQGWGRAGHTSRK